MSVRDDVRVELPLYLTNPSAVDDVLRESVVPEDLSGRKVVVYGPVLAESSIPAVEELLLELLIHRHAETVLVFRPPDEFRNELEAAAKELKVEGQVQFVASLRELL